MIEKLILSGAVIAGLTAAAIETHKKRAKFWDALIDRAESKELKEKLISFRDELPGVIEIYYDRDETKIHKTNGFVWIKEFYDLLNTLTVWKKEEKYYPNHPITIRLIKANDEVLELIFTENEIVFEDGMMYHIFGLNKLIKMVEQIPCEK